MTSALVGVSSGYLRDKCRYTFYVPFGVFLLYFGYVISCLVFFPPPQGYRTLGEGVVYAIMFLFDVLVCLDYNKTK